MDYLKTQILIRIRSGKCMEILIICKIKMAWCLSIRILTLIMILLPNQLVLILCSQMITNGILLDLIIKRRISNNSSKMQKRTKE